ncbi:MAG: flagellar protein FlgJ [Desulfobacteraceae bacterium Eth-SRB1]|nr:MAG: flagellar protein FlgJ [Desulfobacteraceae bacterium Eth-SRB1]
MEGIKLNGSPTEVLSGRGKMNKPDGHQLEIKEEKLKKACADFESIFINYMLKTMRRAIPQSGTKFPGKDIYSTMVDRKVAENLAKRGGGIGLQEMLLRQLGSEVRDRGSGVRGQGLGIRGLG